MLYEVPMGSYMSYSIQKGTEDTGCSLISAKLRRKKILFPVIVVLLCVILASLVIATTTLSYKGRLKL